ncbi:MAG TPA: insulinase family protein, partial [Chakrabartia sp.]|nr:insulinase family protein [Chakrabartia sp.]
MTTPPSRAWRFALALAASSLPFTSLVSVAYAETKGAPAAKPAATPWLYAGSDIPPDPEWRFGVLPNGLRYAVRRNGVPPGQVSIRIGMEAGSLMESEEERGYAHFIEHLSFRGSRYVMDGEAKRVWQRLGATFGSDTNATTTATQTIYKLDLPAVQPAALDESLKILSGMMIAPSMTPAEVDAERRTVLAEAREQFGPEYEVGEAQRKLFHAGQLFANRPPIGTTAALGAATAQSLRAFHDRWYRPERTVISIAGDVDPATFETLIRKYFSPWKGKGPFTPDPDFGKPTPQSKTTAAVTAPGLQLGISTVWLRPWVQKQDTIVYNQGKIVDMIAMRVINRRLETRARAGASFVQASVGQDDVARSSDLTFLQIQPLGDEWKAAVKDVRAIIAQSLETPPSPEEIQREEAELYDAFQIGVETEKTEAGSKLADDIIQAVDIRETVATAQVAYDVFTGLRNKITPEMIHASTRRLFSGEGPRALITAPKADPGLEAELAAAFAAPVSATAVASTADPVSFDELPPLGKPGTVADKKSLPELDLTMGRLSNGVRFSHFHNPAESGKVYVAVRFGAGLKSLPANKPTPAWAAGMALYASGIGTLGQDKLDRMTNGRKIGFAFESGEDAFTIRSQTRASDLTDQLRLIAAKLSAPRWDAAPVNRARAASLSGYDSFSASPQGVLARDMQGLLHGGDARWTTPDRAQIEQLTPKAFKALWKPLLASGPIEVMVFGDVPWDEAERAITTTFGALPKRSPAKILAANTNGPKPTPVPLIRTHKGPADQAAAL